jgi:hypothetical protein
MRFTDRLSEILDNCVNYKIGQWKCNGTIFHIYDISVFENFIKPYSYNTLKRQLNMYNFTVTYSDGLNIHHPDFNNLKNLKKRKYTDKEKRKRLELEERVKHVTNTHSLIEERIENISKKIKKMRQDIGEIYKLRDMILNLVRENKLQDFLDNASHSLSHSPDHSPAHSPYHLLTNETINTEKLNVLVLNTEPIKLELAE